MDIKIYRFAGTGTQSYNGTVGGVCTPGGGRGLQNRWAARKPYRQWVRFPYTSAKNRGGANSVSAFLALRIHWSKPHKPD